MDPLRMSASGMAAAIAARKLSSTVAVEAHIAEICRVNPTIRAVVATRFDQAREEARRADAAVRRGDDLPPLHGVPCTIKESFAVKGMPQTGGLWARRHHVADEDATTVARLRRAGAIVLGVTNVSELCMWMESKNPIYGRTNNPYDPRRVAGGSSGGEGAVVGAGASPFGLGADIGGSIRLPAFFCGVFGHKPTGGLVPGTGQFPIAENAALRYLTTGPITRRAEDLFPLLKIMAGPDDCDTGCIGMELGDPKAVDLQTIKVLNVSHNGFSPVSEELLAAQQRAADWLAGEGCAVRKAEVASLRHGFVIWSAMMQTAASTSFSDHLAQGNEFAVALELARLAMGRSRHTLPALGLALLERVPLAPERWVAAGRALQMELEALIENGVMLFPSYPTVAPRHLEPLLTPWRCAYTATINVLELPATQVPLGLDRKGLPLGLQVVARRGNDHLCIAVAEALERAFGGWTPPNRSRCFGIPSSGVREPMTTTARPW